LKKILQRSEPSIEERVLGILLGTAVGDAKGIPYEGLARQDIINLLKTEKGDTLYSPIPKTHKYIKPEEIPNGGWTDDTQLTLAVTKALIAGSGVNFDTLVKEHIKALDESAVGWGPTTRNSVEALRKGTSYLESGNPLGLGNGVLMKLSPLALYYSIHTEISNEEKAKQVEILAKMSHSSIPAVVTAKLHARVLERIFQKRPEAYSFDETRKQFLLEILGYAKSLELEQNQKEEPFISKRIEQLIANFDNLTDDKIIEISNGGGYVCVDSLTMVYGLFAQRIPSFQSILKAAVLGGDTDSNAAMVGAMIGGLRGNICIPQHYIDGVHKSNEIIEIGKNFAVFLKK